MGVARPLGVEVGQHGGHATQDHAEEDALPDQHGDDGEPLLTAVHRADVAITAQ